MITPDEQLRQTLTQSESDLVDCLARLENEFARKEEFWRNTKDDPRWISTIMVAVNAEVKRAMRVVTEEILKGKRIE